MYLPPYRVAAAPASLIIEPILKRVVPINRTHTYTWGNRAQVENYRSYPLSWINHLEPLFDHLKNLVTKLKKGVFL